LKSVSVAVIEAPVGANASGPAPHADARRMIEGSACVSGGREPGRTHKHELR
jgi:hypothetical protein